MNGLLRLRSLALAGSIAVSFVHSPGLAANDGASPLPQPCAACHLPSAAGVPGVFPPLKGNVQRLAATTAGRRYIVLAISHGLAGPLVIDGQRFNGVMPAQTLTDENIARILNGLLGAGQTAFTAREVAGIRAGGAGLTGQQVTKLRPAMKGR